MRKTGFKKRATKTFMPFIFGFSGRFQWHLQIFMEHIIGKDIDVSIGRLYQVGF